MRIIESLAKLSAIATAAAATLLYSVCSWDGAHGTACAGETAAATDDSRFAFPGIAKEHPHMRMLVANAFQYVAPGRGTIDAASSYPVEGWNHDPPQGLFLRSFTQLTAIGTWVDLLANIAAGQADNPYISRKEALDDLLRVVRTMRHDQHDPGVSAMGLLGNFLGFDGPRRIGPLAGDVAKAGSSRRLRPAKGIGHLAGTGEERLDRPGEPRSGGPHPTRPAVWIEPF